MLLFAIIAHCTLRLCVSFSLQSLLLGLQHSDRLIMIKSSVIHTSVTNFYAGAHRARPVSRIRHRAARTKFEPNYGFASHYVFEILFVIH